MRDELKTMSCHCANCHAVVVTTRHALISKVDNTLAYIWQGALGFFEVLGIED